MQETWVWSLGWEEPLEKGKATHSSILVLRIREFHGLYSPWGRKKSDTTERLSFFTFSFLRTPVIGFRAHPKCKTISFEILTYYIFKDSIPKLGHIYRHQGLGPGHIVLYHKTCYSSWVLLIWLSQSCFLYDLMFQVHLAHFLRPGISHFSRNDWFPSVKNGIERAQYRCQKCIYFHNQ